MRKLVAGLFMSLDGVVETPGKWNLAYFNEEFNEILSTGIAQADAIVLGRRTYLEFAELWPRQGNNHPMAHFMNNTPKYVTSGVLASPLQWANSHLVSGNLTEEISKLKQQPGKDILIPGSPRVVRSMLHARLLDELNLMLFPIVVGSGMRLFEEDKLAEKKLLPLPLKLVQSKTLSNGVLAVTYQPEANPDL